jgi:hypothetical protein
MLATQIPCPHCRTVLKLGKPVPAGYQVKCPACGGSFAIGTQAIQPAAPLQPPYQQPGHPAPDTRADAHRVRTQADHPHYRQPPAFFEPPPQPKSNVLMLSLLVGGVLLFVGAAVGLMIALLSGGGSPDKPGKDKDGVVTKDKDRDGTEPRKDKPADKPVEVVVQKPKPRVGPPPLAPEEKDKVDKALEAGLNYLKRTQNDDGTWTPPQGRIAGYFAIGHTAIAGLTLLECGVPENDPKIQKTAAWIRAQFPRVFVSGDPTTVDPNNAGTWASFDKTYDISLVILFLDRLKDPQDKDLIQKLAMRLVAGQTITGGWHYLCPRLNDDDHGKLLAVLRQNNSIGDIRTLKLQPLDPEQIRIGGVQALPPNLKRLPVWMAEVADRDFRYPSDNSNTQFAILALWAARRHDVPLQRTLALIVQRFRKTQNQTNGSWGYREGMAQLHGVTHPTMTCAGLLGLAVGLGLESDSKEKAAEAKKPADQDPNIKKALDHLATFIGDAAKPWRADAALIDVYFIWSVERVGVIYNLFKIGGKDWYSWGAEMLVARQGTDGSWVHNEYAGKGSRHFSPVVDTCFGLLFLKKANLVKDLTAKLQLGD